MKRREFLERVVVVPLAVQLGLTKVYPREMVPAEELGGKCSCSQGGERGAPGCICEVSSTSVASGGYEPRCCPICHWHHEAEETGICLRGQMFNAISGHHMCFADYVELSTENAMNVFVKYYR